MATLRDGLGGEEIAGSGLQAGATNLSPYFTGSVTSESQMQGTDLIGTTSLSGLNVFATGSSLSGRITNVDGAVFPATAGSPGKFGAIIQAGSSATAAGSGGFVALRQAFNNAEYFVTLTPFSGGSIAAFCSGVFNATSGCNFVGGPSNRYGWMAVGAPA